MTRDKFWCYNYVYRGDFVIMDNKQRWYDKEPTLSLAVSLIKNSKEDIQFQCAEFITQKAQDFGVVLNSNLLGAFNYVLHRWYDKSEPLAEAFGYLKEADEETRKQIAISVIEFLEKAELKQAL